MEGKLEKRERTPIFPVFISKKKNFGRCSTITTIKEPRKRPGGPDSYAFVESVGKQAEKFVKKADFLAKKVLHRGPRYGIFFRHVTWAFCAQKHAEICEDAGGGRPRDGKFPRSMSDFKPGETNNGRSALVKSKNREHRHDSQMQMLPDDRACCGNRRNSKGTDSPRCFCHPKAKLLTSFGLQVF